LKVQFRSSKKLLATKDNSFFSCDKLSFSLLAYQALASSFKIICRIC
jgi:hypothetical protein